MFISLAYFALLTKNAIQKLRAVNFILSQVLWLKIGYRKTSIISTAGPIPTAITAISTAMPLWFPAIPPALAILLLRFASSSLQHSHSTSFLAQFITASTLISLTIKRK